MVFFGFPRFAIYFSLSIFDCAFAQVLLLHEVHLVYKI